MNRPRSIKQNPKSDALPDFRRLGTVLRIVLLVNAALLLTQFASADSTADLSARLLRSSALLQPALLTSLLLAFLAHPWLARLSYWQGAAAVSTGAGLVTALIAWWGEPLFQPAGMAYAWSPWREALLAMLGALLLLAYFRLRSRALSPALHSARLQALQARIRPHFLFNTLNAVLDIVRRDPRRAEAALEDLSDLFRMAMSSDEELLPLREELRLARQYLALEGLRLGERLRVDWQVQSGLDDALIPPLLLQPLLENAVYHGIEPLAQGGTLTIALRRNGERLQLEISNPAAVDAPPSPGNRLALDNIRERLALLFDVEARYRVERLPGLYRVLIELPYLTEDTP